MMGIRYQDMGQYHRYNQWRKGGYHDDEESHALVIECSSDSKRRKPKLYSLLFLCVLSCALVLILQLFTSSSSSSAFSLLDSFRADNKGSVHNMNMNSPLCSSMQNGTICCDRSSFRSDVCTMKGDVRTNSASSSVLLYAPNRNIDLFGHISSIFGATQTSEILDLLHEKIKPYTRKWETSIMDTIDELDLVVKKENVGTNCDVEHNVPAIFFSTGGYTGNVYHEFNDGIIPLYITSQHLKKKVVFVILEYHNWWVSKYKNILSLLSNYPTVDFSRDRRTHCFPEAIVGLKIHDELSVNPSLMRGNKSIVDFRNLLDRAYWPRIKGLIQDEEREMQQKLMESISTPAPEISLKSDEEKQQHQLRKPKLVILSRNGSRTILNEESLVKLAEEIGFTVEILRPDQTTELAKIYHVLNSSDVMVGVHGAAMTHFLFMKPGSVFIQVVPIGTDWPAAKYYGEPAVKLGLEYIGYKILPRESSLFKRYDRKDPVLVDPKSVTTKGWQYTKKVYLDSQNVTLDLKRFRSRLARAYGYSLLKINVQLSIL